MKNSIGAIAAAALLVLALSLGKASAETGLDLPRDPDFDYEPPVPGTYNLPVVKEAADGALRDTQGKPLNLRDVTGGRITVLSFIYTRCGDARGMPLRGKRPQSAA